MVNQNSKVELYKPAMEPVYSCPVCGSQNVYYEFTHNIREYDLAINVFYCSVCQSSYHNPRMTAESMREYYSTGAYSVSHKKNNDGEMNRARNRTELLKASSIKKPTRCLDVGCAQGYLLKELHEAFGAETVGYDVYVDDRAIREIITDKSEITGKFDFISCLHVLEHVRDPLAELAWMNSLLVDDGTLLIEVPLFRQINLPHPIMFSQSSLTFMMKHIGMDSYAIAIPEDREVGIVLGVK